MINMLTNIAIWAIVVVAMALTMGLALPLYIVMGVAEITRLHWVKRRAIAALVGMAHLLQRLFGRLGLPVSMP